MQPKQNWINERLFLFTVHIPGGFVPSQCNTNENEIKQMDDFLYFCNPDQFVRKCGPFNMTHPFMIDTSIECNFRICKIRSPIYVLLLSRNRIWKINLCLILFIKTNVKLWTRCKIFYRHFVVSLISANLPGCYLILILHCRR
jgi:hypothetical protein